MVVRVWQTEDSAMKGPSRCPDCGCVLGKVRSTQDHRRFFKVIAEAFSNWPHDHDFQPSDAEHLRAYLLVECGYAEISTVCEAGPELVSLKLSIAPKASSRKRTFTFVRVIGGYITILQPHSIDFATLSQRDFGPLREAVEGVIEAALRVSAEELLRAEAA